MENEPKPFSKIAKENNLLITGLIQIGACNAEELEEFQKLKIKKTIFIDADPLTMPELRRKVGKDAYNELIWSETGKILKFYIPDFLACSTTNHYNPMLSDLQMIRTIDKESITLEHFLNRNGLKAKDYNTLFIDVEGSEIEVLKGADLTHVDNIYIEFQDSLANTKEALNDALPEFEQVFIESFEHNNPAIGNWGNILFVRKTK